MRLIYKQYYINKVKPQETFESVVIKRELFVHYHCEIIPWIMFYEITYVGSLQQFMANEIIVTIHYVSNLRKKC